ncbi:NAD(P)H quinone oxidoreductase [Chytridium lagenaria]|nr:NAD(P)H quinone oxidoreductase [Chytridium lagenaria]
MRAVVVSSPGDSSKLSIQEVETPKPAAHEVLVKLCRGYPAPFGASQILGVEFSGVIAEPDADGKFKKDDRVFALCYGGAYRRGIFVVVHRDMVIRMPENLSFEEAAAIPEVWFTAYQALYWNCNLQEGDSVLIHAGASGVGTAAIQLCKSAKSKHIIASVGSPEKAEFTENFKDKVQLLEWTEKRGVDVVVDFVGSTHWNNNIESLAVDGRMVMLAAVVSETNLAPILRKRLTIRGSTLRSRDINYQIRLRNEIVEKPVIDKTFSWKNIAEAHLHMESNGTVGKIIVNVD